MLHIGGGPGALFGAFCDGFERAFHVLPDGSLDCGRVSQLAVSTFIRDYSAMFDPKAIDLVSGDRYFWIGDRARDAVTMRGLLSVAHASYIRLCVASGCVEDLPPR